MQQTISDLGGEPGAASIASADSADIVRLRLDIAYDGTDFAGWAAQPGQRTVAAELSAALHTLLRAQVPMVVAGRTDAGVHAVGQVAHIDVERASLRALTPRGRPDHIASAVDGLLRRLAGLLPRDVRVGAAAPAPPGFDARFGALRRHYAYRISTAHYGAPPLRRRDTYSLARDLDVDAMNAAAATLLGEHDFAAYCKAPVSPGATTIRELQVLQARREAGEPDVVVVDAVADAFCHSMVRSLVGVLLDVGRLQRDIDVPADILGAGERTSSVRPAPAHGLTLVRVDYPPDEELVARAQRTRALRALSG